MTANMVAHDDRRDPEVGAVVDHRKVRMATYVVELLLLDGAKSQQGYQWQNSVVRWWLAEEDHDIVLGNSLAHDACWRRWSR